MRTANHSHNAFVIPITVAKEGRVHISHCKATDRQGVGLAAYGISVVVITAVQVAASVKLATQVTSVVVTISNNEAQEAHREQTQHNEHTQHNGRTQRIQGSALGAQAALTTPQVAAGYSNASLCRAADECVGPNSPRHSAHLLRSLERPFLGRNGGLSVLQLFIKVPPAGNTHEATSSQYGAHTLLSNTTQHLTVGAREPAECEGTESREHGSMV